MDKIVTTGLKKTRQEVFVVWNDIFSGKIDAEVLISGSSRAWVHVSPIIIDSSFATNSYNIGFDGTDFEDQYKRYKIYRKYNSKPRYIIQVLDINSFAPRSVLTQHQQLLPYLNDSAVEDMALKFDGFTKYTNLIPFYKYIGQTNYIKVGFLECLNMKEYTNLKYKGYEPKVKAWNLEDEKAIDQKLELSILTDQRIANLYSDFLKECAKEKITVVAVMAPEFTPFRQRIKDRDKIIGLYRQLTARNGYRFIDFSSDPICDNRDFFYNSTHMNKYGAEKFTYQLCDSIRTSQ